MNTAQLTSMDSDSATKVNWDSIVVEPIEPRFDIPVEKSIVVYESQPIDRDWTSYFQTNIVFDSSDSVKKWLMEKARAVYMTIVVLRSDFSKGRAPRIFYACGRSGIYKKDRPSCKAKIGKPIGTKSGKLKKTGTTKCECPFKIKATGLPRDGDSRNKYQWVVQVINGTHNHMLAPYIQGHACHARLTPEEKDLFIDLSKSGIKPKAALSILRDRNPDSSTCLQTLYNAKKKVRKEEMEYKIALQHMMKLVTERDYIMFDRRVVETDVVMNLFFAHPDSIALARAFPYVFIIDSTYKTNVHKWSLFEIVGVTSTMKTFSAAYCFMEHETTEDFRWALERFRDLINGEELPQTIVTDRELALMNALECVFPESAHLLCRWHIKMGIEKKGEAMLPKEGDDPEGALKKKWTESWDAVVYSQTVEDYELNLGSLEQEWSAYPALYTYVCEEWIPYKEKFVSAWTNLHFNLENNQTSRVESAHSMLKDWLRKSSKQTFLNMFDVIHKSIDVQMNQIKVGFTESINPHTHEDRLTLFKDIKGYVSSDCLWLIEAEYERLMKGCTDPKSCGCAATTKLRIPCACKLGVYVRENKSLSLKDVHPFWTKLSVKPQMVECDDLDLTVEMSLLRQRWRTATIHTKCDILRRLRDIGLPQTTWLAPPVNPVEGKGCPSKKRDAKEEWATTRNPSSP